MSPTFNFPRQTLAIGLAIALGNLANAATIDVTNSCTLAAAISNANGDTDTDGMNIGCTAGLGPDTINLETKIIYTLAQPLPLISTTIKINGNGSTIQRSKVLGTPLFRLLTIAKQGNLTIDSLTLTRGQTNQIGGAILNKGVMKLTNSLVSENLVASSPGGAGIANYGNMTLNNCTVSSNSIADYSSVSSNGGGILNKGNMSLENSTVSGNLIYSDGSNPWGLGGGIYNSGKMTVNRSTISGNAARADGGIANTGEMALNRSSVTNNQAYLGGSAGISNTSIMTLTNSTVSNNKGFSRYADNDHFLTSGISNSGKITLSNSSISNNYGRDSISNSATMALSNCTIKNNFSAKGSTVFNVGNMTVAETEISLNKGRDHTGISNNAILLIKHSTITHNTDAYEGGGIWNGNNGTATLVDTVISNNQVVGNGGGIANNGTLSLSNSLLLKNQAYNGGGVYNQGGITINNSTLTDNISTYGSGAGIANKGNMSINHTTLSGNTAPSTNEGGGIKNHPTSELTLSNSIIANTKIGGDCHNEGILNLVGENLIEDGSCGAKLSGDPKLAFLQDNGSPTQTLALLLSSPALNSADKSLCTATDQRYIGRPTTASPLICDLGAFERLARIPNSVLTIIRFLDQQASRSGIVGTGNKAIAQSRLEAIRNQLLVAGYFFNRKKPNEACTQLAKSLNYIDPNMTPDNNDLVTGISGGELVNQAFDLQSVWQCP